MGAVLVRHEPTSAALVRRRLAAVLADFDVAPDTVDDVLLVASELVGNAVRHARAVPPDALHVSWSIDGPSLTVSVTDGSAELPRLQRPEPSAPAGRGLAIVEALSDAWGVERSPGGKRVWARIALRSA